MSGWSSVSPSLLTTHPCRSIAFAARPEVVYHGGVKDEKVIFESLEAAVLAGFDRVGAAGVSFFYRTAHNLTLALQVRVVDDDDRVLPSAPHSLAVLSPCCSSSLRWNRRTDEEMCAKCGEPQEWASSEGGVLRLMGKSRGGALSELARFHEQFFGLSPLESCLAAAEVLDEIDGVHGEYLTEEWAADTAEQVLTIYGPSRWK